jgi:amino acid adenylation domain-containing protein
MNDISPLTRHPDVLYGPHQPELLRDEILADLLEASARRTPEQTALIAGTRRLSYRELDELASLAASRLIEAGIRPGHIVGLWMPRGIELLVMQAAIAKAGAAWLPVDEDTPVERLLVCMEDAGSPALVSSERMGERLAGLGSSTSRPIHTAESLLAPAARGYELKRRGEVEGSAPAYVIYTSGSTGKPKGILIDQRSICHFLRSENEVLGVRAEDRVYQGFSVAFDMSFEEIWISWLVGATLWLGPKETAGDPEALPRLLGENEVTVLHAVPTLLALFAEDVPSLRIINLGGEMCPETVVERFSRPGRQMFNTYGPTEATVSASLATLHPGRLITIGKPLPNYGLLVISAATEPGKPLELLPRGDTGELCITGPGLSSGYLGRPDLTSEKFQPNPWATGPDDARLYRTGDLARIEPDGQVVCLGRTDDQVKIRGFRVELGEIEAVLAQLGGIGTVAVLLRRDDGIDRLVAYLVPAAGATEEQLSAPTLRRALAERLPPYMVPSRFETLTVMPRLTSGKIDRKALKAMALSAPLPSDAAESDVPETPAEEALFAALAQLFPGQPIRRELDFFSDLGGHSFFAARLATALRQDPRFAHVTVRDIYQQRQIGAIASGLDLAAGTAHVEQDWTSAPAARRWLCGLAQLAAVPVLVTLRMAQWLAPFFTYHFMTGDPGDSLARAVAASIGVFLLATVMEFVLAAAGKWLVAGRLQPGSYPLWGTTYYRWWLADRLVEAAPTYLLAGSSLYAWWLRLLGAKVGSDVVIGSLTLRSPDLLTIGDNVSIGNGVNFENARVERGRLLLGPITLADDACVSSYAILEGNTRVGRRGHLEGQSALADGVEVPDGRVWSGSPARDTGAFDPSTLPPRPRVTRTRLAHPAGGDPVLHAGLPQLRADRLVRRARRLIKPAREHHPRPAGALLRAGPARQRGADRADHAGVGGDPLGLPAAHAAGPLGRAQQCLLQEMAGQPHPGIQPERPARHLRDRVRALLVPPAGRQGRARRRDLDRAGRGARHADPGRRNLHRGRRDAGRRADRRRLDDDGGDRGLEPLFCGQRQLYPGRHGAAGRRAGRRAHPCAVQRAHDRRRHLARIAAHPPAGARTGQRLSRAPDLPPVPAAPLRARTGGGLPHRRPARGGDRGRLHGGAGPDAARRPGALGRSDLGPGAGGPGLRHRQLPVRAGLQMAAAGPL